MVINNFQQRKRGVTLRNGIFELVKTTKNAKYIFVSPRLECSNSLIYEITKYMLITSI